jgi:hypothetical protein
MHHIESNAVKTIGDQLPNSIEDIPIEIIK